MLSKFDLDNWLLCGYTKEITTQNIPLDIIELVIKFKGHLFEHCKAIKIRLTDNIIVDETAFLWIIEQFKPTTNTTLQFEWESLIPYINYTQLQKLKLNCSANVHIIIKFCSVMFSKPRLPSTNQRLEDDFNGGHPIDLLPYKEYLNMTSNMGFRTEDALEAAIVTDYIHTNNLQATTDYLLSTPKEQEIAYLKMTKRTSVKNVSTEQLKLIEELTKLHRAIRREVLRVYELEENLIHRKNATVTFSQKCREFLYGLMVNERITEMKMKAWEQYCKQENIDDNIPGEEFNMLYSYIQDLQNQGEEMCVLCKENRKEWCILPCHHVVICGKCAENLKSAQNEPGSCCPLCGEKCVHVEQVFTD